MERGEGRAGGGKAGDEVEQKVRSLEKERRERFERRNNSDKGL